jgi:hypothetical protein
LISFSSHGAFLWFMINGKMVNSIRSRVDSRSGVHIRFSVVSPQVDGLQSSLCQGREASTSPGLRFATQSAKALTHLSTYCYSFTRPFRVEARVKHDILVHDIRKIIFLRVMFLFIEIFIFHFSAFLLRQIQYKILITK